jgi:hypothetical protein
MCRRLLTMVFVMAAMLLAASWLWNPAAGFSRLGAIASRYMLSIGLPFEQWLRSLADLAQRETDPETIFSTARASDMAQRLPWIILLHLGYSHGACFTRAAQASGAAVTRTGPKPCSAKGSWR